MLQAEAVNETICGEWLWGARVYKNINWKIEEFEDMRIN